MKQPFFITGLPRSGTAWLANLFTTSKSLCFHEPVSDVADLVRTHPGRRVGVSDSTQVREFAELAEEWPQARWLYVKRPVDEVLKSLVAFAGAAVTDSVKAEAQLKEDAAAGLLMSADPRVAVMPFTAIRNLQIIKEAWHWLLPEIKFDAARWEVLVRLQVEQRLLAALKEKGH